MANLAETQRLFLEALPEAEEAPSPRECFEQRGGRPLGGPREQRRTVLVASLALAAVACVGLVAWPLAKSQTARVAAVQEKAALIKSFQQCGGEGWTNGTCCHEGCACVAETRYYSQCKTPEGLQECNMNRAKGEAEAAEERVMEKKTDLEERRDAVKMATEHVAKCRKERVTAEADEEKASQVADAKAQHLKSEEAKAGLDLKKAEKAAKEERDKTISEAKAVLKEKTLAATDLRDQKLKAAHDAREVALKMKKDRRAAFDKADQVYADKVEERKKVKAYVDDYDKAAKVREEKECPALFGDCTASNCCVVGCEPHWQNKYFCQCEGPGGVKWCNEKEVNNKYQQSKGAMPGLTKDSDNLNKANDTAAADSKEADEHYEHVAKKADEDIKAAEEEFKVSSKLPVGVADKKIAAAKAKADEKIQTAKDVFAKRTATARSISNKATEAKHAAEKVSKAKRDAESAAAEGAASAAKTVTQAKMALASAKSAVGSWKRAATGNFCGEESDAAQLGF